jgi:Fur family ferric uptake transcriptional regulator
MIINKASEAPPRSAVSPESAITLFGTHLREAGLRFTRQRRLVLAEVLGRTDHFDAEAIERSLEAAGQRVSLATVYRTLGLLADAALIREAPRRDGRAYYEVAFGSTHHDHMVCVECGRVIEFCDQQIEDQQRRVCREYGFGPIDHRMQIRGVCRDCRR